MPKEQCYLCGGPATMSDKLLPYEVGEDIEHPHTVLAHESCINLAEPTPEEEYSADG